MKNLLLKLVVFFGSSAIGLLVANLVVPGFRVTVGGFFAATILFSLIQAVISPMVTKLVANHASAFVGGVGLISVFLSLLVANFFAGGLSIRGVTAWVLGTLIVWVATAAATAMLPKLFASEEA